MNFSSRCNRVLRWFRITDEKGDLSITNALAVASVVAMVLVPSIQMAVVTVVCILNYSLKRWLYYTYDVPQIRFSAKLSELEEQINTMNTATPVDTRVRELESKVEALSLGATFRR